MRFLTLSEKQIKNTAVYNSIREKHIVISISGDVDKETVIPPNLNRVSELHLKFDDISDIDGRYLYFTRNQAAEIVEFVEKYCTQISLIVVQCQAGLSRSVAVAAALSKIVNYSDDSIFTSGIPNMFVYTTILDYFFGNPNWQTTWSKMAYQRMQAMSQYLAPAVVRLAGAKESKRTQD